MDTASDNNDARWSVRYSTKLVIGVCTLVLLTGGTIIWLARQSAQANTEKLATEMLQNVTEEAMTHTHDFLFRAVPLLESMRSPESNLPLGDKDRLARRLLAALTAHPGFSWVSYSNAQGDFTGAFRKGNTLNISQRTIANGHSPRIDHQLQADGSWKLTLNETDGGYDPRTRPFYIAAEMHDQLVWVPPYVLFDSGQPGVACATPVHDAAGKFLGVLTVEFDLHALSRFFAGLKTSEHSEVFLFTPDQILLAHRTQQRLEETGKQGHGGLMTLADIDDPDVEAFRANIPREVLTAHVDRPFDPFQFTHDGVSYFGSASSLRIDDRQTWIVGAVAPQADFLGDVWRTRNIMLSIAAGAILLALVLAFALARRVSEPVNALIAFMRTVGSGDLNARANFGGPREFNLLSHELNRMIEDLRDRLRLRQSLDVAMEVQQRLLPAKPPIVRNLDIAGHSTYCDETGGDYYDFLIIDDSPPDNVIVAIGDVMGHGVAAALVMAGTRAVLRDRADSGNIAALMTRLNQMLAADLGGMRFMTMHLAVVDTKSCSYRWANAGHDAAIMYDPETDSFDEREVGGFPLGIAPDSAYEEYTFHPLKPGHVILVGTDGIWEMPNEANDMYGKDRLRELIRRTAHLPAAQIVDAIVSELKTFRGSRRPADDVTLVVMKMQPTNPPPSSPE